MPEGIPIIQCTIHIAHCINPLILHMFYQVKESKRQFIFDVVNEGGESEKMELFVNFCEDTIFEMQLASQISEPDALERPEEDEDDDTQSVGAEEHTVRIPVLFEL